MNSVEKLRAALLDRPAEPFRGSEADVEAVRKSAMLMTYLESDVIASVKDEWVANRIAAYMLVKHTGLTYFDLCGVAPLPDYLIIEHVKINQWVNEAQEKRMRKGR